MHSRRAPLRRDIWVFISAVSRDLGTVRQLVKKALEDSGYHAVEQANFPLDYRDVRDKLHNLLSSCDAVIHIAGQCFGETPPQQPDATTRRSYTQLEYDLARDLDKPVYVFITDEAFPTDPHAAEDEEHSRLQAAHRQALMQTGKDYCRAISHEDIDQKVRSLPLKVEILTAESTWTSDRVVTTVRHLKWWLVLILVVVLGTPTYLVRQGKQQPQKATNDFSSTTCTGEAKANSDMVSRVFFRGAFLPEQVWQTLHPTSQELFYEWQVLLSVNEAAKDIALEIHHLPNDRITIDPITTGVLSEPVPQWYSGFPEPHRSKPDYLLSTAKFSHLSPDTPPATVTIRRFLAKAFLSSNSLIKIKHITALNCRVRLEETEQAQDAERLQRLAQALAERVYQANETGAHVQIRRDPGDLAEQEIQGTMEVRCQNELCTSLIANRFEGHMGKSPLQYVKEKAVQQLTQLKEALGELLPCFKGPYEDTHPTNETLILEGCSPLSLSPEEMQRVQSVMEKHGFKLELLPPSQPNQNMKLTR
jgi:hypothetical protein